MNNNIQNIIIIWMLTFVIIFIPLTYTQVNAVASNPDEMMQGAKDFVSSGEANSLEDEDGLSKVSGFIYNLLLGVALIIAMVVGIVIGIKFMMASVEEKAQIKELLLPYLLGCIVIFGALGIWKLGVEVFGKI